jgi:hypothetical protein
MAAAIPNAVFVPLEGSNHVLLDGEPAQARFFKELQDFMRDCAVEYTKSHLEMAVVPRIADMIGGPDRLANTKPTNVRNWDKASIGKRTATASAISAGAPWPLTDGFVCCRGDSRRVMSSGTGLPGPPHAAFANSGDRRAIPIATRVPSTSVTGTPASPNSSLNCGPMTLAGSACRPLPSAQVR